MFTNLCHYNRYFSYLCIIINLKINLVMREMFAIISTASTVTSTTAVCSLIIKLRSDIPRGN